VGEEITLSLTWLTSSSVTAWRIGDAKFRGMPGSQEGIYKEKSRPRSCRRRDCQPRHSERIHRINRRVHEILGAQPRGSQEAFRLQIAHRHIADLHHRKQAWDRRTGFGRGRACILQGVRGRGAGSEIPNPICKSNAFYQLDSIALGAKLRRDGTLDLEAEWIVIRRLNLNWIIGQLVSAAWKE